MLSSKDAIKKLTDYYLSTNEAKKRFASVVCGQSSFKAINLQPPKSKDMLSDIASFQKFLADWRDFPYQDLIEYGKRTNKFMDREQSVPEKMTATSVESFINLLSSAQKTKVSNFLKNVQKLEKLFPEAPRNCFYGLVNSIWDVEEPVFDNICAILPQLKKDLGKNLYIRALPVNFIDTKFLENNEKLIFLILQTAKPDEFFKNDNDVACVETSPIEDADLVQTDHDAGATLKAEKMECKTPLYSTIHEYLGVREKPSGFVYLRVCDGRYLEKVGNFSIVMVSANDLLNVEPPCSNLLVIENEQSGFMVPDLPDTSIIFGCGNNLAWAKAAWLKNKTRVFYWGDIDSWGYFMLSQFRLNAGREVNSLMMDLNTIEKHAKKMVSEPMSKNLEVSDLALTCTEAEAYAYLRQQANNRLEQEKLDQNFVLETIQSIYGR